MKPVHRTLEQYLSRDESEIDVAVGAALIATDEYSALDVPTLLERFDVMASPLRMLDLAQRRAEDQAAVLGRYIYDELGFRGNEANYFDVKNSLLPDVLDRRVGIPIMLGLVYCEIARRVGVRAVGVSFPGHFLVRLERRSSPAPLLIDPFFGGKVLGNRELTALLKRALGQDAALRAEHLAPASPRAMLTRMLTNLKMVYLSRGDFGRAHLVLYRILTLVPETTDALKERGMLAARLGALVSAKEDLGLYLRQQPHAPDAREVRAKLTELRASPFVVN